MEPVVITGIGADVEVFIQNVESQEVISAEGYIQGTKQDPFVFDHENPHFATSLDNVLAEFGIPPANNKEQFYEYLQRSLAFIGNSLPTSLCTAILPSAYLNERWLKTRQSKKFGCEPDYNAYTMHPNERPTCAEKNLRSAGGHIHVGYENAEQFDFTYDVDERRSQIVKALDLYIGVPSVLLEPDNKRKELYGKAGAFRPKNYGLEYRTVSNFYLASKELCYWVYQATNDAATYLNAGNTISMELSNTVQNIINTNDKPSALMLIRSMDLIAEGILKAA